MIRSPGVRMRVAKEHRPAVAGCAPGQQIDVGRCSRTKGQVVYPGPAPFVLFGKDIRTGLDYDVAARALPAGTR